MTLPALVIDILSWAMIAAGSFFVIIGAVGILRFPDFWSRLHAASVTESGGYDFAADRDGAANGLDIDRL